ncbi:MAG: Holliday junction resolvase RuvX [Candidatus Omnitrophica bacterium]|nr:Holliday junction resolvase RuvX [Candidatus Omnitrophota bacterium]
MRILCLDIGERRIGLAISDETGTLARGLATVERNGKECEHLARIIKENKPGKIVYGLPVRLDGSLSLQTEKTLAFIERLKAIIQLPFIAWDERLTTKEAEAILLQADLSRQKRKRLRDKLSAQIILQSYLEASQVRNPGE